MPTLGLETPTSTLDVKTHELYNSSTYLLPGGSLEGLSGSQGYTNISGIVS